MPWDNEGRALEDFYQGLYCGFCGAAEPCAAHYAAPGYSRDELDAEDDAAFELSRELDRE